MAGGLNGDDLAERSSVLIGSWRFLIIQSCFLVLWLIVNSVAAFAWDKPPYILLNLLLSFQAAFTGPVLLIAANVAARRDRAQASRIEGFAAHVEKMAAHVEKLAAVDHEEHGRLLRDLHAHTRCDGHTVIETASPRLRGPDGRFIKIVRVRQQQQPPQGKGRVPA